MEQKKIERINELAKKAKTEGLSEDECLEQVELRAEYLRSLRANLKTQLDQIVVLEPDGNKHSLKKQEN